MAKRGPETRAAVVCFALAILFGVVTAQMARDPDVNRKLVAVEADFSVAEDARVTKRAKDGKTSSDETSVDAVYRLDGKTYRHRVSEEYAVGVVSSLPGRGVILVDANDPSRPPRRTMPPAIVIGGPLLASIFSVLVGVVFFRRRHAQDER